MPATAIVTKLGAREVSRSREYISGLTKSLPELYSQYTKMTAMAEAEKDPTIKKILVSGANGIFLKFSDQRNEIITRIAEVSAEVSKDATAFASFVEKFLPLFKTQQEMTAEKQK